MIADCLNYNLRFTRDVESVVLLAAHGDNGSPGALRGIRRVGRRYDRQRRRFGDGVTGEWRVPGEFGKRVTVDRENTTLYASDRDMFVFLADEDRRIEVAGRSLARGFFVWNSEVGDKTLGAGFFLFDYVCCLSPIFFFVNPRFRPVRSSAPRPA